MTGQKRAPASEMRDLNGVPQAIRFANEAFHYLAIFERGAADPQRRRHRRHKTSELVLGYGPHLNLDAWASKFLLAHQAGLRRLGSWECIEPIAR